MQIERRQVRHRLVLVGGEFLFQGGQLIVLEIVADFHRMAVRRNRRPQAGQPAAEFLHPLVAQGIGQLAGPGPLDRQRRFAPAGCPLPRRFSTVRPHPGAGDTGGHFGAELERHPKADWQEIKLGSDRPDVRQFVHVAAFARSSRQSSAINCLVWLGTKEVELPHEKIERVDRRSFMA